MRSTGSLSTRAANSLVLASSALVCSTSAAMRGPQVSSGNVFGLQPEVDGTGHSLVLVQIVSKEVRPESLDVW